MTDFCVRKITVGGCWDHTATWFSRLLWANTTVGSTSLIMSVDFHLIF